MTSMTVSPDAAERSTMLDGIQRWLVGLEGLLAIGAYAGAIGLLTGVTTLGDSMRDVPFESTVLAGIALGLVNGVLPTAVAVGTITHRAWATPGHLVVGVALMGWILVQIAFIGPIAWLQPVMFIWGAAIFVLGSIHARSSHSARSMVS
jgi:hypothetical protein